MLLFDSTRGRAAALTITALLGCDFAVSVKAGPVSEDSTDDSSTGEDSTGPAPDSSSSGESSTGDLPASTSSDDSTGGDTGESSNMPPLLPLDAPCDDAAACESGVCSPLGACAPACPCGLDAVCVAGACLIVGEDGEGADSIPINESPAGSIDADDLDIYGIQLTAPGSYRISISGLGVTAWVLDSTGDVLADPDDASNLDDTGSMTSRLFDVRDSGELITVIVIAPNVADSTPYYFWTH